MKQSDSANSTSSGITSGIERPVDLNPAHQLELEADDAQAAIKNLLQEMRRQLQAGADPKRLTREHPWIAVGTAAVAGFVGAMVAVPSKEDAALKRLARIERALNSHSSANGIKEEAEVDHASTLRKFALRMFKMIKPTLLASITSALTAKASQFSSMNQEQDGFSGENVVVEEHIEQPPPPEA